MSSMQAALQAAGHYGCSQGEGLYVKPSTQQEIDFYQNALLNPTPLNEFLPAFMGTLHQDDAQENRLLLVMEDLCSAFNAPNILDVKLGRVLFDANASLEKQERLRLVAEQTTSGSLGFRIAGMTIMRDGERVHYDKNYGREASVETVSARLSVFWSQKDDEYIMAIREGVIARIRDLQNVLAHEYLELRSASVLILYEGDLAALRRKVDTGGSVVDVRLIDFAHTRRCDKPDLDVVFGLHNLAQKI